MTIKNSKGGQSLPAQRVTSLALRTRAIAHVYRPQPVPHVLQRKVVTRPTAATIQRKMTGRGVIQRMEQFPKPPQVGATQPPPQPQPLYYAPLHPPAIHPAPTYGYPAPSYYGSPWHYGYQQQQPPPQQQQPHVPAPQFGYPQWHGYAQQQQQPPPQQQQFQHLQYLQQLQQQQQLQQLQHLQYLQQLQQQQQLQQPQPQQQPQQPVVVSLRIADLEPAILQVLGQKQAATHIANSTADANGKTTRFSKLKGIHSVLDSRHKAEVASQIYRQLSSNPKLLKIASEGEGSYNRPQAFQIDFGTKCDGWQAEEERFGWGDMIECHIRGCRIDNLNVWVEDGAWRVGFHFVPLRYLKG